MSRDRRNFLNQRDKEPASLNGRSIRVLLSIKIVRGGTWVTPEGDEPEEYFCLEMQTTYEGNGFGGTRSARKLYDLDGSGVNSRDETATDPGDFSAGS